MNPRRRRKPLPAGDHLGGLLIDSGALSAATTDPETLAIIRAFAARGWPALTPIPVLAETVQGNPRDAALNRVLAADIALVPCDEAISRQAGALRTMAMRTAATPSGIDAIVAATAVAAGTAVIMTTDPDDLEALTTRHADIRVLPV